MIMTDDFGAAMWEQIIPPSGIGLTVWFQACQFELTTNVAETTVVQ